MRTRTLQGRRRRGQNLVEVAILFALVGLALVWVVSALSAAITHHYKGHQEVMASPL